MKKAACLAAALLFTTLATPIAALAQTTPVAELPAGAYKLDPTHTSVTFKVKHMGLSNYTARFAKAEIDLDFNPKDPSKSTVAATIDPLSIKTDYPFPDKTDFDKELSSDARWLNAGKFPAITFKSTKVEVTGENTGKITGDLTLLGVTKPVVLDVTFNAGYAKHPMAGIPALGFSATTTIKRSDWGFTTFVPAIGDEVQIFIETEFTKPN
ncbi:YceI family protein [Zavarzinia compransoris]|uniref:Polyisoprenoid-binding protein n=1 Tax=Zavarzinia compransoris TaxID=1264899 RepID=A0A317DZ89_9PROT|nr:YceI family protein [Zavarzinia compransoris]PWR20029.1 polyisoprenoid-binding protein [Zavarzinia compransoris]TDP44851.1 polyisoprenoid-binding protein YceI [Zavarzinia compransoris]